MYYIYHIPNIKVGCTEDPENRIINKQGYNNFEILYKTNDLKEASDLEIYYQNILFYKNDKINYLQLKSQKMLHTTHHTITFKGSNKENLSEKIQDYYTIDYQEVKICEELKEWIIKNAVKSQFSEEMFIYKEAFFNKVEEIKKYNAFFNKEVIDIFEKIRQWAKEKGIIEKGDPKTQCIKLFEEAGELSKSILKNDEEEFIDAIGDCVVVLTNLASLKGYNIEDCIKSAYEVISKRTGKMENGTFIKD